MKSNKFEELTEIKINIYIQIQTKHLNTLHLYLFKKIRNVFFNIMILNKVMYKNIYPSKYNLKILNMYMNY